MEYPVVGIPVCTGVCVYVWGRLGDMRQVKRGHRAIVEDALEQWAQVGVTKTAAPWVESLFRRWMERREYLDTGRCIRGSLYRTFGLVFSYWKWVLASVVAGALVLGYASGLMAKVVFVGLGVVVQGIYLPIAFDDMLLPAGRRERCYATIATAAVVCLLLLATAGAVTFLSWLFSPLMPDLFGGQDGGLHYAPINGGDISLSCLLVPWFFAVRLFAYRFAFAETIAGWGFVTAIILLIFFGSKEWLERIDAVLIAGAFICGWVFFLLAAWHVRVRGPLAELPLAGGSDA
ncbi:MAG: hypothetical protein A2Y76_12210 [Planctomycetes bacterium RBG_13_60_9]|nr:MAG: hypothetical protein A2Y76_12210 [Planctomycetes bacterium RBG_13_60_9]